jgi:adenosylmethionine-8-amino-7-oxononanoate aminotransferase
VRISEREERLLKRTFLDYRQTTEFLKEPLILHKAEGLSYWDTEGRRYFDGIGGVFVATLGHRHPRVMEAMRRQMDLMTFAPPLHGIADVTLDFVEKLGAVTPEGLTYVKPFSGGSESVEAAFKFVRQYFRQTGCPGKYKVVSRYLGYHGGTFGAMAASGTGPRKTSFEPQMSGFLKVWSPLHYRDQFKDWDECNRFAARMFEDIIVSEDPATVAAVIVEPVGNTGGVITPTAEYYRIIREACDRHNVVLIFDEVITGFGRCGAMFAAQAYGVTPDIICSGKGVSSGAIPFGNMIARQTLGDAFLGEPEEHREFAHGHTFAGNPLACAAGIAVIDEIVEKRLAARANVLGERLAARLEGLKKHGVVREVRGKGVFRGVELVRDAKTLRPFPELGIALKRTALRNGLIMRIDPTWFAVAPALVATEAEIDELCDLVEKSLVEAIREAKP